MKFLIDRASLGADDVKPCEGAIKLDGGGYGIKIKNIEDLMKIIDETGFPIIVYGQDHTTIKGLSHFLVFTMTISSEAT